MIKSINFKKKLYNFIFLSLSFFIFFYLAYFLFFSENGLIKHISLKNEYNRLSINHNEIVQANKNLANKINKLKIETIDLDYLDELNIDKNGNLDKDDIIIPEN